MATPLPPPLFGATPSALPNGTIPALATGDFLTIERKTDGKVFNALVGQFDTRYTTIAQGVLAAAIGDTVQAHSTNLDAWAAVAVADYLTIAAGNAAYQPLNAYLSQFAGLTPGPATDGYVPAWNNTAEAYELVAQTGGGGGTSDHAALSNLAFADAGHTGFAGLAVAQTFTAAQTISAALTAGAFGGVNLAFSGRATFAEQYSVNGTYTGTQFISTALASINNISSFLSRLDIRNSANIATYTGFKVDIRDLSGGGGTATTYIGLNVAGRLGSTFNATTGYGVKVDDVDYASTAYALYTGTGAVSFGDAVTIRSKNLTINQASTTAAIPVLRLNQADLSEEFIRFESTVGAGNPIDTAALGSYYGKIRVYVEGVGAKWMALYD